MTLAWPAPAKLNLFLHITGRRPDGYHELQTLFQFLDFGDQLTFAAREDGAIRQLTPLPGVAPEEDLTVRAARRLREVAGSALGVDLRVDKRIPIGAGLGGGSSDAATTLVGLNHAWRLGLTVDELAEIGLGLGADVPVFVRGLAGWAEGVGEEITPVELPEPWFLVLTPPVFVSTREIYSAPDLVRDCPRATLADHLAGRTGNVCEPVTTARHPAVKAALDWARGRGPARMSGTGGSVFVPFADEALARRARDEAPPAWHGVVARGLNLSPLAALTRGL